MPGARGVMVGTMMSVGVGVVAGVAVAEAAIVDVDVLTTIVARAGVAIELGEGCLVATTVLPGVELSVGLIVGLSDVNAG